ncbi:MAG: SUMF1/EgtB/PvdO family nonheme iron enzyme [Cyanobacteria bacterium P01_F01_bin.150]
MPIAGTYAKIFLPPWSFVVAVGLGWLNSPWQINLRLYRQSPSSGTNGLLLTCVGGFCLCSRSFNCMGAMFGQSTRSFRLNLGQAPLLLRGGSWINNPRNCRSANRNRNDADNRNNNIGFRLVCSSPSTLLCQS